MKLFVVFVVFGFLGCALGDEEGGDVDSQNQDGGASSSITCPSIPENEPERPHVPNFLDRSVECLAIDNTGVEFENLTTVDDFRQQSRLYCLEVPVARNCLANMSKLSETCTNQTQHQPFRIFLDMLESALEIVCRQDGSSLAVIVGGMTTTSPRENVFGQCLDLLDFMVVSAGKPDVDASAKILMFYRHLGMTKECFQRRVQDEELRNVIDSFVDEIKSGLKCIHPETRATVLCSTIGDD